MTTGDFVSHGVVKESRALFPAWIACMAAVGAAAVTSDSRVFTIGLLAYALGAIAIGAQSVGHEYSNRTLGLLLAQPAPRERLLSIKAGVLGTAILTLWALAAAVLVNQQHLPDIARWIQQPVLVLAALCGFFIAPWLTMLTRSPLAAMVFSVALPPTLLIVGDVIGAVRFGIHSAAEIDRFKLVVLWRGMFVVCAIAAVSSWRMFMRLEAIEGRGPEVRMPQWLRASPTIEAVGAAPGRHRQAVWSLIKKEIRLQQMTFVVAGLYILGLTALSIMERVGAISAVIPVGALSILYFLLLSILIGSLASAEERQFGTLEWQVLLPMASSKQWLLKTGVAIALALLLGVAVTLLVMSVLPLAGNASMTPRGWLAHAGVVILLTTIALYVSSLTSSGVWAMVLCLPVILGAFLITEWIASTIGGWLFRFSSGSGWTLLPQMSRATRMWLLESGSLVLAVLFGAGLVALLLRFGFLNHRSAERGLGRLRAQAIALGAYMTLASFLLLGFLMVVSRAARAG